MPTVNDTLPRWLAWLEQLHPTEIELGLERVGRVADRLKLRPAPMPLILVGGTNGKGSTVTLLSNIYRAAGYKVGAYTSPHIELFNERMCINGDMLDDQTIVDALHTVESAREPETLTYFEYTTLAAMVAFVRNGCTVAVMEVGLGGRLDATNLWDCDCAILTSIALDHQAYLGNSRESVAREKVAIGRSGKPMIVGEPDPPDNLANMALSAGMQLQFIDNEHLPNSALSGQHQQRNAACAVAAVAALQPVLPVEQRAVDTGLSTVYLPGRFECITVEQQAVVLDVAHNPAAADALALALQARFPDHQVLAVFSALKDKDIVGIASALAPVVSSWYCAELCADRAMLLSDLVESVSQSVSASEVPVHGFASVVKAWRAATDAAGALPADQKSVILVAGSFFTLTELRESAVFIQANHQNGTAT